MADDKDLREIEDLHEKDRQAALAQDRETLASLWSADGVMLAPGGPRLRGGEIASALLSKDFESSYEMLEYRFDFEEVRVLGDYAYEWGTIHGKTRDQATGTVEESGFKLLRILHKEDGEWKVHRAMWNSLGPA